MILAGCEEPGGGSPRDVALRFSYQRRAPASR